MGLAGAVLLLGAQLPIGGLSDLQTEACRLMGVGEIVALLLRRLSEQADAV